MTTYPFSQARTHFSDLINGVQYGDERPIISKNGKDVAAVISIDDLERLIALEDMLDLKMANAIEKEIKEEGTISWEDLKSDLKL